jgi:uncharacterized membrane protein YuzA (DUF378 family)
MKATHIVSFILLAIGGLNWGLIGLGMWFGGNWNVVYLVFGSLPWLEGLVYVLVGIATVVLLVTHKKNCSCCKKDEAPVASAM